MRFDLKRPCTSCPFKKGSDFLYQERAKDIADAISKRDLTFQCHNTVVYSNTGRRCPKQEKDPQHCAGALIVLIKEKRQFDNFRLRFAAMLNLWDYKAMQLDDSTVDSLEEFVNQHDF